LRRGGDVPQVPAHVDHRPDVVGRVGVAGPRRHRSPPPPVREVMSWAAHQFEIYAVQAHLPKKMKGKVSFWGIWLGDFTPDFLSKFWVYGITIGGHHYGAASPQRWHRGWPGMGFTHTLFLGIIFGAGLWAWKRS